MRKSYVNLLLAFGILVLASISCSIKFKEESILTPPTQILTKTCTPTTTPTKNMGVIIVDVGLHLREKPTENSKTLLVLLPNSEVEIIGYETDGWLCVEYQDSEGKLFKGYVNGDFVSVK